MNEKEAVAPAFIRVQQPLPLLQQLVQFIILHYWQPGDIGLKSKTGGTGGANHVGIYCGTLKNGTVVWIHCTSSSSTSLTGNSEGAMFGAYTNFTYFRRLKKWYKD